MRDLPSRRTMSVLLILTIIIVLFILVWLAGRSFTYFFARVNQNEVGVQFRGGKISKVVGPGVYSDVGIYVEMKRVSSQAVPFSVEDPEIITSDKQRIGLVVSGDIFRPNLSQQDMLLANWDKYSTLYLDNAVLVNRVEALARQAMKVCVGSRKFDDSIIGTARDALRTCIDDELSAMATNYGLEIQNVTVPNVELSPEVQTALDSIVQSRLSTEKAAQDKLKADAEALAEQARQEGEIRVAQGRLQEETRQKTLLAKLEQEKLLAEKAVIEAQKANDLLSAQSDLEINKAQALAAAEKAKSDLAKDLALAELYAKYDGYLQLQIALANASALKLTDKIIFTLEGMMPNLVIPGPGITPTVDTGNTNPN
jgi:SPFH domain / Band 7 family